MVRSLTSRGGCVMAEGFFVTIVGRKQGKFKPEGAGAAGKIKGLAFHYEVASPRDAASGQASGKRQHSPVSFVKTWGAASPQLFQAAVTNEVLDSVLFEFVETTPEGKEAVFQTVKLTNAFVASIKQDAKAAPGGHELQDLEEVSIVFQSIEMENLTGKTAAADDWRGGEAHCPWEVRRGWCRCGRGCGAVQGLPREVLLRQVRRGRRRGRCACRGRQARRASGAARPDSRRLNARTKRYFLRRTGGGTLQLQKR